MKTHRVRCCFCGTDYDFGREDFMYQRTSGWHVECPTCGSCECDLYENKPPSGPEWLDRFLIIMEEERQK